MSRAVAFAVGLLLFLMTLQSVVTSINEGHLFRVLPGVAAGFLLVTLIVKALRLDRWR